MGLAAAAVLIATSLAGSHLPPVAKAEAAAKPVAAATSASTASTATVAATTQPAAAPTVSSAASSPAQPAVAAAATTMAATAVAVVTPAVAPAATSDASVIKVAQVTTAPAPDIPVDQLMAPGPLPENILGDAKAPVTIVEYASMTCPHCADFHKRVFPDLKTKYIDTGKARLVFREFPLDNLAAAVSELARCLGPVRYFAFIGTMFDRQAEWHTGDNDLPKLQDISKQAGFTDDSFKKCVTDQKLLDGIKETRKIADEKYHVDSTPTFFINGIKLKEGHEMADFDTVMAPFLK